MFNWHEKQKFTPSNRFEYDYVIANHEVERFYDYYEKGYVFSNCSMLGDIRQGVLYYGPSCYIYEGCQEISIPGTVVLQKETPKTADQYLQEARDTMIERGKQYDSPEGERSMEKIVSVFNTITGKNLTESEGWLFMSCLKKVRQYQGKPHLDSCVDDVAYAALFAESRMREQG